MRIDLETMDADTKRAVGMATAKVLDILAERVEKHVPADTTFTRDEVTALLHGMGDTVRAESA